MCMSCPTKFAYMWFSYLQPMDLFTHWVQDQDMEGHCYGWHLQILGMAAGPAIAGLLSHVDFEMRFLALTPTMSPSFIVMLVFKEPLLWRSFLTKAPN